MFKIALFISNVRYRKITMPKVVDHDRMRTQLALQCMPLFAREGYARLSMRRIATEIGTSTGTLYHYFPNKAALFQDVVRACVDIDISEATQLLAVLHPEPKDRLVPLLTFAAAQSQRLADHFRVLAEFGTQDEGQTDEWLATLQRMRDRYIDALAELLGTQDKGKADVVLLTIVGLILRAMCGDPTTEIERAANALGLLFQPEPK
jgi:AcrR family transcriptional regulator